MPSLVPMGACAREAGLIEGETTVGRSPYNHACPLLDGDT